MSIWKKTRRAAAIGRLQEEELYAQAHREIERGIRRDGLWAKALQRAHGREHEAKALYIQYRVQSLKDEAELAEMVAEAKAADRSPGRTPDRDGAADLERAARPVDQLGDDGYTPLMRAVHDLDFDQVASLLEQGADPNMRDGNFGTSTALSMAILMLNRATADKERQLLESIVSALESAN